MVTGAASAEAALLLIDASEGVQEQSRRHGFLLSLLGFAKCGAREQMDLKGYSDKAFKLIEDEYRAFLKQFGVEPKLFIPIAAAKGDNVANKSTNMPWYNGRPSWKRWIDFKPRNRLTICRYASDSGRLSVRSRRILAGRVESGILRVGDKILFSRAQG